MDVVVIGAGPAGTMEPDKKTSQDREILAGSVNPLFWDYLSPYYQLKKPYS